MDMFSDAVVSILEDSGWKSGRRVLVEHWINRLEGEGFTMSPEAIKVLETFGGLEIVPRKTPIDTFLKGALRFDPVLAASGEFERVNYWQERLNTKLSPLAEGSKGEIVLLAQDGRVFSCYDGQLFLDGLSFEDALENTLIVAKRKSVAFGRMSD
jgi:SUKH-3 immunity protein